jgi:hypothetical protein
MERMKCCIWILCLIFLSTTVVAQKKIATQTVNESITYATVDRPGDLYVVTATGQIQKFDKDGKVTSVYKNNPAPTLFDPRDGARLFAYFRSDQHFAFLNPSFDVTSSNKLDAAVAIDPWLMCVSGDYNFWVLDAADITLKKINAATGIVTVDAKVSEKHAEDISSYAYLREYQGFVFLLHKEKGVLIFSGMGRLLKVVGQNELTHFNFLGEELYFQTGNTINFFNLFTAETREMPLKHTGQFILLTDERLFIVQKNSIDFFEISP